MAERVASYIDGFNLAFGVRTNGGTRHLWLDVWALSQHLLVPRQELAAVKYFTSRISDPDTKRRDQSIYIEALEALHPKLRIKYGKYSKHDTCCRSCGCSLQSYREKMTDVNIATELLVDAIYDAYDTALLISGDSDLCAPLVAIRAICPAKRIVVAFPPNRTSTELQHVASAYLRIGRGAIAQSQMPDSIPRSDGYILQRPQAWT